MRLSKGHEQLINAICEALDIVVDDLGRTKLRALFADREVQCVVTRTWMQDELDATPTGFPRQPADGGEADQILDKLGVDDPDTSLEMEMLAIQKRVDELKAKMDASRDRPPAPSDPVPVRKANMDEFKVALRRAGHNPDTYEPY